MQRCNEHKKEAVGSCMWCGKHLCPKCVSAQHGSKLYCEKCSAKLGVAQ